jgi:nucleotide-binding universal stress UspA family protein
MRRKILLPTDFSRNAWHAINYALELYKEDACDFYLLNVFSFSGNIAESLANMVPGNEIYETAKQESENGLVKILDTLMFSENGHPNHHFKSISRFNHTIEAIKDVVEEKDIEMIVMGTRGETVARKAAFGSTAVNVMEKVRNCPVIVVPKNAIHSMPKEIVFPTSYKTHFKLRELNFLIEIAKRCQAAVRILHVADEDALDERQISNKNLLNEYFEDIDHSFHELRHMEIPAAINCFIESRNSDMVTFINKKHAFFTSMLTHPLVKEISYHSKVPILVMHDLRN